MRSERTYEVGERVLVEVDPKHQDIDYREPIMFAEAIVTSCTMRDDGKTFEVDAKLCEHERDAIARRGAGAPCGGIVHPLTSKGLLVRYQNLRRESDEAVASANTRSRHLLEALTAVGKGLGDDLRASLARIEASLAGRK